MNQIISNYLQNTESQEYKACSYEIDGIKIIERTAKITPKENRSICNVLETKCKRNYRTF